MNYIALFILYYAGPLFCILGCNFFCSLLAMVRTEKRYGRAGYSALSVKYEGIGQETVVVNGNTFK